jgi:hypothetical protein
VNFSSYIKDGTVVGHYILDEPYDPANWGGRTISSATVDELAKYSKQIWPDLPTIVRARPGHLKGHKFKYLDAAWSQYSERFGSAARFITEDVRQAKAMGLALVVGMNQLAGGSKKGTKGFVPGKYAMAASELESWGNTLLADAYPCAFISWKYDSRYMGRSDVKAALARLAGKASNQATKSCRARGGATPEPASPSRPDDGDDNDDDDGEENPPATGNSTIKLKVSGRAESKRHRLTLTWSGASGRRVDVYRNGSFLKTTENDSRYTNLRYFTGRATASTYVYKVCERGKTRCSNEVKLTVR